jgi:energy-converting hydrogenase Eha subunit C
MHAVTIENNILFHADRLIPKVAVGIALETAAIGTPAYFALFAGYVKRFAGLVPNKTYYLDIAGALVDVKPVSGIIQAIGYSLSATEMFVSVQLP